MHNNLSKIIGEVFSGEIFFSRNYFEVESEEFFITAIMDSKCITLFFDRFENNKTSVIRNLGIKFSNTLLREGFDSEIIVFDNRHEGDAVLLFQSKLDKKEIFKTSVSQKLQNVKEFFKRAN